MRRYIIPGRHVALLVPERSDVGVRTVEDRGALGSLERAPVLVGAGQVADQDPVPAPFLEHERHVADLQAGRISGQHRGERKARDDLLDLRDGALEARGIVHARKLSASRPSDTIVKYS